MKRILMMGLLTLGLGGCNGGDDSGGGTSSTDYFTTQVLALVGTAPEDTEPTDYSGIPVTTSETGAPIDR